VRLITAIFAVALVLHCQTLPANWAGAGSAWNPNSKPPVAGWVSYATTLKSGSGNYSFTSYDILLSKKSQPITSARTGFATILRQYGPVLILGFGDAGIAAGATVTASAFSGGGVAVIQLGKGWSIALPARYIKSAAGVNQMVYEIGIGRSF
jgi:hypothetical protein